MKTTHSYMETRKAVVELAKKIGTDNIKCADFNRLAAQGHSYGNLDRAMSYARYGRGL